MIVAINCVCISPFLWAILICATVWVAGGALIGNPSKAIVGRFPDTLIPRAIFTTMMVSEDIIVSDPPPYKQWSLQRQNFLNLVGSNRSERNKSRFRGNVGAIMPVYIREVSKAKIGNHIGFAYAEVCVLDNFDTWGRARVLKLNQNHAFCEIRISDALKSAYAHALKDLSSRPFTSQNFDIGLGNRGALNIHKRTTSDLIRLHGSSCSFARGVILKNRGDDQRDGESGYDSAEPDLSDSPPVRHWWIAFGLFVLAGSSACFARGIWLFADGTVDSGIMFVVLALSVATAGAVILCLA